MRYFIDTEFAEDGRVIDLISIALVAGDGRFYYAISNEFDPEQCNDWVKENVLPKLPPRSDPLWKDRATIAKEILAFVRKDATDPEFWGYFADYDWVVFCQLFGRMVDLPEGFPMYCLDVKQIMHQHGASKSSMPQKPADAHDALADAHWHHELFIHCARAGWVWGPGVMGRPEESQ